MSVGSTPAGPRAAPEQVQKALHSLPCARSCDTQRVSAEQLMPLVALFTEVRAWDEEGGDLSAA